LPQREFQYLALGLISKFEKKVDEGFITTLEYLITTKSWWDTVDTIAGHPVGMMFKRFPKVKAKYLKKWRTSDNFWLRRTTLLFQLGYKEETDFELLCELIKDNLGSDEFFINKAIGWALRQYAHTKPEPVRKFVKATKELHPLSQREALKNIG
jgi:3-methyladenine DNA glycosylase AlkD